MDQLLTLTSLLAVYGGIWIANTLLAIRNNLAVGYRFEWKYFWDGVIKAVLGAFALSIGAISIGFIPDVFAQAGVAVDPATADAISILGVIGAVGAGIIYYAKKFITSVNDLFNTQGAKLTMSDNNQTKSSEPVLPEHEEITVSQEEIDKFPQAPKPPVVAKDQNKEEEK